MSTAPVCHIPPATTTNQPSPLSLPSVPPAQPNIASLVATVNALRQLVLIYTGQQGPQGIQGAAGKSASGSWTQKSIKTQMTKIYQNNDPSTGNFVEVQTVTQLVMANQSAPGQTWTYNAPPSGQ